MAHIFSSVKHNRASYLFMVITCVFDDYLVFAHVKILAFIINNVEHEPSYYCCYLLSLVSYTGLCFHFQVLVCERSICQYKNTQYVSRTIFNQLFINILKSEKIIGISDASETNHTILS